MIAYIDLQSYGEQIKAITEEQIKEDFVPLFPDARKSGDWIYGTSGLVHLESLSQLCAKYQLTYTVKPFTEDNIFLRVNSEGFLHKMDRLTGKHVTQLEQSPHTVAHIHVPNFALMTYNKVEVHEDLCTNALQDLLDKNWRILCVMPPTTERRPSYVLGRYVPE